MQMPGGVRAGGGGMVMAKTDKCVKVSLDSSLQRLMVKATQKSNSPRCAIFNAIVYCRVRIAISPCNQKGGGILNW